MTIRYTDSNAASRLPSDFVIRKYVPTLWHLLLLYVCVLVIGIFFIVTATNKPTLIITLSFLLGSTGSYVLVHVQRSRDLVLATEFQNALFASALGFNNKFCLIIKKEGNIVYMDNAFQKLFPDLTKERHRDMATVLKLGKVAVPDREKVFAAIERGTFDKVIFDLYSADNRVNKIVMTIEPIPRPSGFILLRAREYVEQRAGKADDIIATATSTNPLLNKSTITTFAYIMNRMNMGIYMTDPAGKLIFINPVLESWLAFREGEIMAANLSLKDIVRQGADTPITISPEDFEGEATMHKKEGGIIKTMVNQKIVYGDNKKVLGCIALIHNILDIDPNKKKALW